jgi:hypothetical protein
VAGPLTRAQILAATAAAGLEAAAQAATHAQRALAAERIRRRSTAEQRAVLDRVPRAGRCRAGVR